MNRILPLEKTLKTILSVRHLSQRPYATNPRRRERPLPTGRRTGGHSLVKRASRGGPMGSMLHGTILRVTEAEDRVKDEPQENEAQREPDTFAEVLRDINRKND